MLVRRRSFAVQRREVLPLAALGLLFSFSSLFLFRSYRYMDAGIASTLLFLYPLLVAVIMVVGFRERISPATFLSILLALGGIALLYRGGDGPDARCDGRGAGLPLVALLCDLYRGRQPLDAGLVSGREAHLLCAAVRVVGLSGASAYGYRPAADPDAAALVRCRGAGALPHDPLARGDGRGDPPHRIDAYGDSRGAGARHGALFGVAVFGEAITLRIVAGVALILVAVSLVVAGGPLSRHLHLPLRLHRAK